MSGHSKWSQIKRKKGAKDAAKGKLFTKLIREITVSAREGGGDPTSNARLRLAVQTAKENNMPQENINRAIKKGTGELEGVHYEEVSYEGYGPGGVALMIDTLTDNKNRTTAEVRRVLTRHSGNLGEAGCVSWIFDTKGVIFVPKASVDEEKLLVIALDAGAEDVRDEGDGFEVLTSLGDFEPVRHALAGANIKYETAEIQKIPKNHVKLDGDDAHRVVKLMEGLEDLDDVQRVSANFDVPPDVLGED
jgi:YebC/PmpR family DNA-binding regulatory protein